MGHYCFGTKTSQNAIGYQHIDRREFSELTGNKKFIIYLYSQMKIKRPDGPMERKGAAFFLSTRWPNLSSRSLLFPPASYLKSLCLSFVSFGDNVSCLRADKNSVAALLLPVSFYYYGRL